MSERDEDVVAVEAMAHRLLDAVTAEQLKHNLKLEAILAAYISVATAHPCCTQAAANASMRASMHLARTAAQRPADAPIH